MSKKEIEENYAISRRIEAEERALETATMVLTSTQQEIDEQWGLYDGCAPGGFHGTASPLFCSPNARMPSFRRHRWLARSSLLQTEPPPSSVTGD
jgi:hypothetical protein